MSITGLGPTGVKLIPLSPANIRAPSHLFFQQRRLTGDASAGNVTMDLDIDRAIIRRFIWLPVEISTQHTVPAGVNLACSVYIGDIAGGFPPSIFGLQTATPGGLASFVPFYTIPPFIPPEGDRCYARLTWDTNTLAATYDANWWGYCYPIEVLTKGGPILPGLQ